MFVRNSSLDIGKVCKSFNSVRYECSEDWRAK